MASIVLDPLRKEGSYIPKMSQDLACIHSMEPENILMGLDYEVPN